MECCLGGELWTVLRDRGRFDDDIAKYVSQEKLNKIYAVEIVHVLIKRNFGYQVLHRMRN